MANETKGIPQPTMERLPMYLNYFKQRKNEGCSQISSADVALDLRMTAIQVRKDLACVCEGRPRTGRSTDEIIDALEMLLGCREIKQVVIVGAGRLGQALMDYEGFGRSGFHVAAAFDNDPARCNVTINGRYVYPMREIGSTIRSLNAEYGIITVPDTQAQYVCDILVAAGIKAILNFAPIHLIVPEGIVVKDMDMGASMLYLSNTLAVRAQSKR